MRTNPTVKLAVWLLAALTITVVVDVAVAPRAFADDASTYPAWATCKGDSVRYRAGASTNHEILGVASQGEAFVVLAVQGDWAKLQVWPDVPVWISTKYVRVDASGASGTVTGSNVNVRRTATIETHPLGQVDSGVAVRIAGESNGYYRILPPPGIGVWMSAQFIEVVGKLSAHQEEWRAEFARRLDIGATDEAANGNRAIADGLRQHLGGASANNNATGSGTGGNANTSNGARSDASDAAKIEASEREILGTLAADVRALLAKPQENVLVEEFDRLSTTLYQFADACETAAVAGEARKKAGALLEARAALIMARERAETPTIDPATVRQQQEELALQRQLHEDLWRHDTGRYTAQGVVIDEVRDGKTVYLLQINGETQYELRVTSAFAADVNLRNFWNQGVGIKGKIVSYATSGMTVLYVESIEQTG